MVSKFFRLIGGALGPVLETKAAMTALKENQVSHLAAPSPPRAGETWMLQVTARIKMQ